MHKNESLAEQGLEIVYYPHVLFGPGMKVPSGDVLAAERRLECPWRYVAAEDPSRLQRNEKSGHVVGVAWQPDRVKWSQKFTIKDGLSIIDHNLKQNNQTIRKNLRDDRPIGGFEATTAFERGRAEEEEERGAWNALKR